MYNNEYTLFFFNKLIGIVDSYNIRFNTKSIYKAQLAQEGMKYSRHNEKSMKNIRSL